MNRKQKRWLVLLAAVIYGTRPGELEGKVVDMPLAGLSLRLDDFNQQGQVVGRLGKDQSSAERFFVWSKENGATLAGEEFALNYLLGTLIGGIGYLKHEEESVRMGSISEDGTLLAGGDVISAIGSGEWGGVANSEGLFLRLLAGTLNEDGWVWFPTANDPALEEDGTMNAAFLNVNTGELESLGEEYRVEKVETIERVMAINARREVLLRYNLEEEMGTPINGEHTGSYVVSKEVKGRRNLGTLGGVCCYGVALNAEGKVAGAAQTAEGFLRAFVWTAERGMRDLGTFGGKQSWAKGLNDAGQVTGWAENSYGNRRAFLWAEETGLRDLGTLGGAASAAVGLNRHGQVVGHADAGDGREQVPFVWTAERGMEELRVAGGTASQRSLESMIAGRFLGRWNCRRGGGVGHGAGRARKSICREVGGGILRSAKRNWCIGESRCRRGNEARRKSVGGEEKSAEQAEEEGEQRANQGWFAEEGGLICGFLPEKMEVEGETQRDTGDGEVDGGETVDFQLTVPTGEQKGASMEGNDAVGKGQQGKGGTEQPLFELAVHGVGVGQRKFSARVLRAVAPGGWRGAISSALKGRRVLRRDRSRFRRASGDNGARWRPAPE